jgi:DNA polymerase
LRADVYGGKLVENLIQAYCRDLLAAALVRLERAKLPVVAHVHDEAVSEVDDDAASDAYGELLHQMTLLEPWAAGFPIGADGWTGKRYRK